MKTRRTRAHHTVTTRTDADRDSAHTHKEKLGASRRGVGSHRESLDERDAATPAPGAAAHARPCRTAPRKSTQVKARWDATLQRRGTTTGTATAHHGGRGERRASLVVARRARERFPVLSPLHPQNEPVDLGGAPSAQRLSGAMALRASGGKDRVAAPQERKKGGWGVGRGGEAQREAAARAKGLRPTGGCGILRLAGGGAHARLRDGGAKRGVARPSVRRTAQPRLWAHAGKEGDGGRVGGVGRRRAPPSNAICCKGGREEGGDASRGRQTHGQNARGRERGREER